MTPIERGIALGVVGALMGAAALLARERAAREQPGEGMGVLAQALQARGGAHDAGVAPERLARLSSRRSGGAGRVPSAWSSAGEGGGASGPRVESAWSTARRANTKHSLSEFEARRLAPCRPVQEDSPTA